MSEPVLKSETKSGNVRSRKEGVFASQTCDHSLWGFGLGLRSLSVPLFDTVLVYLVLIKFFVLFCGWMYN